MVQGKARAGTPTGWNYVASAFTRPIRKSWESSAPLEGGPEGLLWRILWCADNAGVIAVPTHLQDSGRAVVRSPAVYEVPFSAGSFEHLRPDGCDANITLEDGRCFGLWLTRMRPQDCLHSEA